MSFLRRRGNCAQTRFSLRSRTGIDIYEHLDDGATLAAAARAVGMHVSPSATGFDDVFFHLFLEKVERTLGWSAPASSSTTRGAWPR